MPWQCFMVKSIRQGEWQTPKDGTGRMRQLYYTLADDREVTFADLPVGAMWRTSQLPAHHRAGPPDGISVVLPGKHIWRMFEKGSDGCTWSVTGEAPNLTASPSINFVGRYHGYVQNGMVTDDVDGRQFDQSTGYRI